MAQLLNSQSAAGALLRARQTKPALTPAGGQAGVFAAEGAVPSDGGGRGEGASLLAHAGTLGAEAAVAGDLELLRLLQDPAGRLAVVGAGGRRADTLLWRSGRVRRRRRRRYCTRVLAGGSQPEAPPPREPLAADGVGLRESRSIALAPRSAGLSPPSLPVSLPRRPGGNQSRKHKLTQQSPRLSKFFNLNLIFIVNCDSSRFELHV